jgi:glycine cleavage system pyridoxal-binding protein P
MGHCIISYLDDGQICSHMAKRGYTTTSGARGLKREARKVANMARRVYNTIPERVKESMNDGLFEKLEVKLEPQSKTRQEINVFRKQED